MKISINLSSLKESIPLQKSALWIHEHPTTAKVIQVAGLITGMGLLVSLPFLSSPLAIGLLGACGALQTTAFSISLYALDILVPPHHDMKTHLYKPGQCEGGRLYYEGDVPILSLEMDHPYQAGEAHGYLCGQAISTVTKRFDTVLHTFMKQPRASELPKTIEALKKALPSRYLQEIEGIAAGYNKWAKEQFLSRPMKLTVEDILLIHLIPDSLHFNPAAFERLKPSGQSLAAVACTSIVDRDPEKGFVFARNMDWPSFGVAGAYSLVIHRKQSNQNNTVEVSVPVFVGTLTGMNEKGLSLAMNVCASYQQTKEMRGLPAAFYNRLALENCDSVQDLHTFIQKASPLGAYHLTAADPTQGSSIHFYQGKEEGHALREWKEEVPLVTLNCRYNPKPAAPFFDNDFTRNRELHAYFQENRGESLERAQSLPTINNWLTTHRVRMEPATRTFQVAFDNAFAGRALLQAVSTDKLFDS